MLKIANLIDAHRYQLYYIGDLKEDTIAALESIEDTTLEEKESEKREIFSQLPNEDELVDIEDVLHCALKCKKSEMMEYVKQAIRMLEDKNMQFCNAQSYAATLLRETKR